MGQRLLASAAIGLVVCAAAPTLAQTPPEKIGVLVTDWGSVRGISREYSDYVVYRSVVGDKTNAPGEPCTENHVGTYPYQSEKGLLPFVVSYQTPGYERFWDSSGIWRLSADGKTYTALLDETVRLSADQVGDAKVTPLKDVREADVSANREAPLGPDPRDGADYLAGLYKIDKPNGLHDVQEMAVARWMRVNGLLGHDPNEKVELEESAKAIEIYLKNAMAKMFGPRVDVRTGYYAKVTGVTHSIEETALAFANDGFKKLVIARETTDHNTYANTFWDLYHTLKAFCRAGIPKGDIAIQQVRQVGRTPEYNTMLARGLARHMALIPKKSDVSVMYVTYGLPWPGGNPDAGPFGTPQPFVKEVYHENAFLNFLSFKPYALAAFGKDYAVNFARTGIGDPATTRTANLFAYGMTEPNRIHFKDDPEGFRTVREMLDTAIRVDKRKEIVLVLSHWYNNVQNTLLDLRFLSRIPINSKSEMKARQFWSVWCERYTAPDTFDQAAAEHGRCPPGFTRLQITEAFDAVIDQFASGYAQRVRGGVERYGVLPNLDIAVAGRGQISKLDGGSVSVVDGTLQGARLDVPPDPRPLAPEGYTWNKVWRPSSEKTPYDEPDAIRPVNRYDKLSDYLDAAKDDFPAYIGRQGRMMGGSVLRAPPGAASPVVLIGPYRTLFNAPARVTLPYDPAKARDPAKLKPMIYNDLTEAFDPVYPVAGGAGLMVDEKASTVSFDVQVLGNFVLVPG